LLGAPTAAEAGEPATDARTTTAVRAGETLDVIIRRTLGDTPFKENFLRAAFVEANPRLYPNGNIQRLPTGTLVQVPSAADLRRLQRGILPEMAAAVAKLMSNKDLVMAASRIRNLSRCRSTLGARGVLGIRIQPNHPGDDVPAILLAAVEGLLHGCGDAVIGVNPAIESLDTVGAILHGLDRLITRFQIPTQHCCLAHITTQLACLDRGVPIDLLFQSIGGTQLTNESFGVSLGLLQEGRESRGPHQAAPGIHGIRGFNGRRQFPAGGGQIGLTGDQTGHGSGQGFVAQAQAGRW
jgi:ethanolamine ammonia-lyase large subunit